MSTGLDRVAQGRVPALTGRRVALLINHTAIDRGGRHAVEVLRDLPGVTAVRVLAPEHGPWGTHQDMEPVACGIDADPVLGLPVMSLYGADEASLTPNLACFEGIDTVIYDIQDIGTRFYTSASTLLHVMEAAPAPIEIMVLDRPNPLGPHREGPLLRPGFESFCGVQAGLPIRHGMTVGQLARWFKNERNLTTRLTVIDCDHAARLPFQPTSPNMPTLDAALVYPGLCFIEGTTLSEGRGTTSPFQLIGAPGIDPFALADELRPREIPGIDFIPRVFRPEFGKHAGQQCGGVYLRVFDHSCVWPVALAVHLLEAFKRVAPDAWAWRTDAYEFRDDIPAIDLLWGSADLRETIDAGGKIAKLITQSFQESKAFRHGLDQGTK